MAGRDITEGRSARSIAIELGIGTDVNLWQNTSESYEVAIGGLPFYYGISNERPYYRQTLPYKKDQFDSSAEPGEQSLTGWWLRSQSSFHKGSGIKFYDPTAGEIVSSRFADCKGVDVWTKGQVSLLKKVNPTHEILYQVNNNGRAQQYARSIQWTNTNTYDGVLLTDGYDVDKLYPKITVSIIYSQLTSNVVTLDCTEAAHNLEVGMQVVVSGLGAPYDGEFRITAIPSAYQFSYAVTNANIAGAYVTGTATSEVIHFIDYNSGADYPVYAICDDGTYAYWVTNKTGTNKLTMYKKPLNGNASNTADVTQMFTHASIVISNAAMEYVKERVILAVNNSIYEIPTSSASLPTAIYTHPNTDYIFTSIAASGPAIYISGYNGIQSTINKFTLSSSGTLPTLTSAAIAAEMPVGEIIHKIYYYLGYMMIGTSKGIRVASVNDQDGSISYGPLIVETSVPCYDFAAKDKYVWCASNAGNDTGVVRIDLGSEIEPLRFAYANDIYDSTLNANSGITTINAYTLNGDKPITTNRPYHHTTGCAFIGDTNQLLFTASAAVIGKTITGKMINSNVGYIYTKEPHGIQIGEEFFIEGVDATFNNTGDVGYVSIPSGIIYPGGSEWQDLYVLAFSLTAANVALTSVTSSTALVKRRGVNYIEDATDLMSYGYIKTGNVRFNTLEPKHFERILGRGDFTFGSMSIKVVDKDSTEYDVISYDAEYGSPEGTIAQPTSAQEYLAYKFELYPDGTYASQGPIFKGYQAKALIATKRQRQIQFPVFCYDMETDKNNVTIGYEGRAMDRITALEELEAYGDIVVWQDLTTKEVREVQIDSIQFTRMTPPEKRFNGFGGVINITVRTI